MTWNKKVYVILTCPFYRWFFFFLFSHIRFYLGWMNWLILYFFSVTKTIECITLLDWLLLKQVLSISSCFLCNLKNIPLEIGAEKMYTTGIALVALQLLLWVTFFFAVMTIHIKCYIVYTLFAWRRKSSAHPDSVGWRIIRALQMWDWNVQNINISLN